MNHWNLKYIPSTIFVMAFSLEYSSSFEDELEQHSSWFDIVDIPSLRIPSPFQSDSSSSETATSAGYLTSGPDSPATPLSPGSSLGGEFSFINISSQTSATSNPQRRKKYVKRKSYPFKKGQQPPHSLPIETSPHSKRLKVESPKTALFSEMRFPSPVGSYRIKTGSGLESTSLDVTIPTGNSICNLEILSLFFAQLNCIDRECYGRLKPYERHIQDGLQCFLLLKYTHCPLIVAEFPTTWCRSSGLHKQQVCARERQEWHQPASPLGSAHNLCELGGLQANVQHPRSEASFQKHVKDYAQYIHGSFSNVG